MNGNGTYLCEKRSNCHPVSTNVSSASNCTMNGQTYKHGDLIDSECEKCRCNDGGLFCTYRRKTCSNATDNDQSPCKLCRKNTFNPVCGPDGQTYPSECHAVNCIGIPPLLLHEGSCSGNVSKFCHDHVAPSQNWKSLAQAFEHIWEAKDLIMQIMLSVHRCLSVVIPGRGLNFGMRSAALHKALANTDDLLGGGNIYGVLVTFCHTSCFVQFRKKSKTK